MGARRTSPVRLALRIGTTSAARTDVLAMLDELCVALPSACGVAAALLVLGGPADPRDPGGRRLFASDPAAHRIGALQDRSGRGPVPAAIRTGRVQDVADVTRDGAVERAAGAAGYGSVVLPFAVDGRTAGALQLLRHVGSSGPGADELGRLVAPVLAMLSARLADVRELARLGRPAGDRGLDDDVGPDLADGPDHGAAPPPTAPVAMVTRVAMPGVDLFADGDTATDTPPAGQPDLGWVDPDPTPMPTGAIPARLPAATRIQRAAPVVPDQRRDESTADAASHADETLHPAVAIEPPTSRLPRHRLRGERTG